MTREHQEDGLVARLRALRLRHPALAILTEIVQLDERRATFRATIQIDGEPRARGHASRSGDPTGAYVAAAEQLAVEQALLLGGFAAPADEAPTRGAPVSPQTVGPAGDAPATERALPAPSSATKDAARDAEVTGDGDPPRQPELGVTGTDAAPAEVQSDVAGSPADATASGTSQAATAEEPTAARGRDAPPARRQRDRRGERERARARQAAAAGSAPPASATAPEPQGDPAPGADSPSAPMLPPAPAPDTAPEAAGDAIDTRPMPADEAPAVPESPPLAVPRPPRSRPGAATPRGAPEPTAAPAPSTREALRAAWRPGRPIPAWWPPDRAAVGRPLPKARAERLRAAALAEEITAAQLDTYSVMLFGVAVAELTVAQGELLEERLHPTYPSPLEDLRARRVLHPLAVGDAMEVPPDGGTLVRWSDIPPAEETPPPAPPPATWRQRGPAVKATRRRR